MKIVMVQSVRPQAGNCTAYDCMYRLWPYTAEATGDARNDSSRHFLKANAQK